MCDRVHRYLVRFQNSGRFTPVQTIELMIQVRKEIEAFHCVAKNLRISDLAIEFDLYAPDEASKERAIGSLSKKYGSLLNEKDLEDNRSSSIQPSQYEGKEETIQTCLVLFNEQRYWECHETLEQLWRRQEKGKEKDVQQGIILAASALVHFQRNENEVCLGMIPRTLAKLDEWSEEKYYSFDIGKLKDYLREMYKTKVVVPRTI